MPYMVKIAQLMIPQPPWGRKYRYLITFLTGVENIVIFAIRAAVSEIQLLFNFKW